MREGSWLSLLCEFQQSVLYVSPLLSKFGDPCAIHTQEKKRIPARGVGQQCAAFQPMRFIYIVPLAALW